MKVLMPDEVEKHNIITRRELQAILIALQPHGRALASRAQIKAMESVAPKIRRTLEGMKG